jgi:hypothetical protein
MPMQASAKKRRCIHANQTGTERPATTAAVPIGGSHEDSSCGTQRQRAEQELQGSQVLKHQHRPTNNTNYANYTNYTNYGGNNGTNKRY